MLCAVTEDPIYIFAVLALSVALAEWLARKSFLRHLGSALLVIVIAAVFANTGVIPAYEPGIEIYDGLLSFGAYIGVFWLLLLVRLTELKRAGGPMLVLFGFGALGTIAGVVIGMWVIDGPESIGEHWRAIGGMFVGTYTGGSANLNILAAEYGVATEGALYVGVNAVDAILTTFYMIATIAIPRLLWRALPARPKQRARVVASGGAELEAAVVADRARETEPVHPFDLAILLALGAGAYWLSGVLTESLSRVATELFASNSDAGPIRIPRALVITTLALVLAQVPAVARLRGVRVLGMLAVMLFLAVIGCLCDLAALQSLGELAMTLWIFATVVIAVHALVIFGLAFLFRLDWDMAAVASQANVGGGTTALALARSLGRPDLVLPAILIGSLGTATGTYLGYLAIEFLLKS